MSPGGIISRCELQLFVTEENSSGGLTGHTILAWAVHHNVTFRDPKSFVPTLKEHENTSAARHRVITMATKRLPVNWRKSVAVAMVAAAVI